MGRSRYFENSCLLLLLLASTLPLGASAQSNTAGNKRKVALGPAGLPVLPPSAVPTVRVRQARSEPSSSAMKKLVKSSYPSGPYERGLYYKQRGLIDEALLEFIHAAQINPRDTRAFFEQAKIFEARGLNKLARSAMEQALALEPTNVGFRSELVQLHFQSGNLVGAAAEVGKMFNLNQSKEKQTATSAKKNSSNFFISAPAAAVQVASGQNPLPPSSDASSAWLNSAVATDTGRSASAAPSNLDEVLSSIGEKSSKDTEMANAAAPPPAVAQILNSVPSTSQEKAAALIKPKVEKSPAASDNLAEVLETLSKVDPPKPTPKGEAGLLDRANSMFAWAKERMPFAHEEKAPEPPAQPQSAKAASRTAALMSWAKEKIPFAHVKEPAAKESVSEDRTVEEKAAEANSGKLAKAVAVASWAKEKIPFAHSKNTVAAPAPQPKQDRDLFAAFKSVRDKLETSLHIKPANDPLRAAYQKALAQASPVNTKEANDSAAKVSPEIAKQALRALQETQGGKKSGKNVVVNTVPTQEVKNADSKSNLPPEIAKALEGKFDGPTVISTSNVPQEAAAKAKGDTTDELVRQVLGTVPSVKEPEKDSLRPESSGPKYGLLSNNALKHIGASQPPELEAEQGNGIMGMLKQAGKTFAGLMPSIKWSLPTLPAFAEFKRHETSPLEVIASVPAHGPGGADPVSAESPPAQGVSPLPPPTPVENVLNAIGGPVKAMAEQVQSIVSSVQSAPTLTAPAADPEQIAQSIAAGQAAPPAALPLAVPEEPKAPSIVPLDVSRILSKISSSTPSAPQLNASNPVAPSLSTMMPIAANPASNYQAIMPQSIAAAPQAAAAVLPTIGASGFNPTSSAASMPQSTPQASAPSVLPQSAIAPMVQDAIKHAQPLLKPAFDAANQLAQSIAPMVIPHSDTQAPQVVATQSAPTVANAVPAPVSRDMANYYRELQKYYQHAPIPDGTETPQAQLPETPVEQSAGPARRLIDVQRSKSGAFTFMKPVIDSDRNYMLGAKQVRTIQPLPGKPMEAKAAVPEDAITRRMRYLLEHGTGTLRPGEAFMFSEETGEGTLFLPDGRCEKRKLQDSQDAEKVLRTRRPDIVHPKDIQYSLSLLGKLLPPQQEKDPNQQAQLSGPTLDQLMQQMNQSSKGFWGWMKKSLNMQ